MSILNWSLVEHIPNCIHLFATGTVLCPTSPLTRSSLFLLTWERKRREESICLSVCLSISCSSCAPLSRAQPVTWSSEEFASGSWRRPRRAPWWERAQCCLCDLPPCLCGSHAGWGEGGLAVRVPASAVLAPLPQGSWSLQSMSGVFRPVLWTVWGHVRREWVGGELRVKKIGPLFFENHLKLFFHSVFQLCWLATYLVSRASSSNHGALGGTPWFLSAWLLREHSGPPRRAQFWMRPDALYMEGAPAFSKVSLDLSTPTVKCPRGPWVPKWMRTVSAVALEEGAMVWSEAVSGVSSRFVPHQMVYLYADTETRSLIGFLDREEPSGIDSHHRVCAHTDGGEVGLEGLCSNRQGWPPAPSLRICRRRGAGVARLRAPTVSDCQRWPGGCGDGALRAEMTHQLFTTWSKKANSWWLFQLNLFSDSHFTITSNSLQLPLYLRPPAVAL